MFASALKKSKIFKIQIKYWIFLEEFYQLRKHLTLECSKIGIGGINLSLFLIDISVYINSKNTINTTHMWLSYFVVIKSMEIIEMKIE